jgi:hypothetical protein
MSTPISSQGPSVTRRDLLRRSASAAALAALGSTAPSLSRVASAQSPKRDLGVCLLRLSPLDSDGGSLLGFPRSSPLAAQPLGANGCSQARGYGCRCERWRRSTSCG